MKYLLALSSRVLIWVIWAIKVPFAIVGHCCREMAEWLDTIIFDIRAACPWPWITKYEALWEKADHEERRRLLANLRGETM